MSDPYDTVIIGGGPAGLSAALVLGRCVRRVLICDGGRYRNDRSHAIHCFMSQDSISLPTRAREQLVRGMRAEERARRAAWACPVARSLACCRSSV